MNLAMKVTHKKHIALTLYLECLLLWGFLPFGAHPIHLGAWRWEQLFLYMGG